MWILNGKLTSHGEGKYWILTIWNYSVMKLYELITGLMKMTRQIWHRRFILPLVLETIRLKNESYQFAKFWWKGNQLCSYSCLTGDWSKRIDFRSFTINNNFFFPHADSLVFVLFAHTSQIIHPKAQWKFTDNRPCSDIVKLTEKHTCCLIYLNLQPNWIRLLSYIYLNGNINLQRDCLLNSCRCSRCQSIDRLAFQRLIAITFVI